MIQFFPDGLEGGGDVRVIHQPAELRVALARHHDFYAEAVAVQPPAFVLLRQVRQQMRRLKLKRFA